jgi:hypothetical protein
MNDILQKVKQKYSDFDITSRHISNIVRDNNITLKLTRFRHEPTKRFGKDININKNIKLFYEKVKQYKIDLRDDGDLEREMKKYEYLESENSVIVERVRDVLLKHIHKKYLRNILVFLLYLQKAY